MQVNAWDGDQVLAVEGDDAQLFVQGVDLVRAPGPGVDRTYQADALGTVQATSIGPGRKETWYAIDALRNVWS